MADIIYTDVLSVREFGAIGDGIADDTSAIQEAIDIAFVNRKALFIPSGIYLVDELTLSTTGISSGHPFTLIGEGSQQSILKLRSDGSTILSVTVSNVTIRPSIRGIGLDGNAQIGSNGALLDIINTEYGEYQDIHIINSPDVGISDDNGTNANYLNVRVDDSGDVGIELSGASMMRISNARFNNNTGNDLDVDANSTNCVFDVLPAPPTGTYSILGTNNIMLFDGRTQYIADDSVSFSKLGTAIRENFVHITWGTPSINGDTATITGTVKDETGVTVQDNVIIAIRVVKGNTVDETTEGYIDTVTTGTRLSAPDSPTMTIQTSSNGQITIKIKRTVSPPITFRLLTSSTFGSHHFYRDANNPPSIVFP